jgi:DNA (cytosine-5)-methyltransferase 1
MAKLAVIDGPGLRQLTIREGLRLFGFPENYQINLSQDKAYDLLGNTVVVTVIKEIAIKLLTSNMLFNKPKTHNAKFVCKK